MTSQATDSAVRTSVVDAPAARAFMVFTEKMANWWPPEHHRLVAMLFVPA